jgi:LuxR family maltose regulon positive regulatory protein
MAVLSDGPGAGLTDIVSARRWATSLDVPVVWADAIGLEAMVRIVAGQDDSVDALLVEADHLRRANIRLESTNARLWLAPASAVRAASSGDVELARVRIDEAVQLVVAVEPLIPWAAPLALGLSARARALIGDVSAAGSELAKAEAALGRVPPSPFLERSLAIASEEVVRARSLHDLTPTELTVCDLLTTRATLAEIAQELHVSRETVKSHTSAIYRKFGVSSRRELQDELGEIPRSG